MSILLFFVVLFVLILVHEWGHFIAAKKTGMRVDEFGIGFPPKLFGMKKGETEYTFNALPIGGFVRIYGENAADAASDAGTGKDISGSFTEKPKWAQALVLIAGVTMNVVLAWVLFTAALTIGVPAAVDEANATPAAKLLIQEVMPGGVAATAGIPGGAVITDVRINDASLATLTPSAFRAAVEGRAGQEVLVTYEDADAVTKTVSLVPEVSTAPEAEGRAVVGVRLALIETKQSGIFSAMYEAAVQTGTMLKLITVGITTLIVDSFTGTADFSSVTGPVGIVGMVGDAAAFGFTSLLMFTAMISLNLAVINLLPFPALDGGRLVFVAAEVVMRRPVNPVWMARVNAVGFLLLMTLMVVVTYKDIVTRL